MDVRRIVQRPLLARECDQHLSWWTAFTIGIRVCATEDFVDLVGVPEFRWLLVWLRIGHRASGRSGLVRCRRYAVRAFARCGVVCEEEFTSRGRNLSRIF